MFFYSSAAQSLLLVLCFILQEHLAYVTLTSTTQTTAGTVRSGSSHAFNVLLFSGQFAIMLQADSRVKITPNPALIFTVLHRNRFTGITLMC
jgi:hypothetical protein